MVNPNLEFYMMAGQSDLPRVDVVLIDQPSRGVIGVGDPPIEAFYLSGARVAIGTDSEVLGSNLPPIVDTEQAVLQTRRTVEDLGKLADEEFAGSRWAGSRWAGSRWAGSSWAGSRWAGSRWADEGWAGSRWAGSRWAGSRWAGVSWTGDHVGAGWAETLAR